MVRIRGWFGGRQQVQPVDMSYSDAAVVQVSATDAERHRETGSLPRFRVSATDLSTQTGSARDLVRARLRLREVFTPAQPVTDPAMFAGRLQVLALLIEVLEERLAHVVVFGERGIGKTSLLHIVARIARESRYQVVRTTCGGASRFDDVFRGMLSEIPLYYLNNVSPTDPDAERGGTLADRLPEGAFTAHELSRLLGQVTGTRILILLDEYDRIESLEFRLNIAELIKNLSDQAARVQIVLAGVASNLQDLIGHIPSIRRNIVGLPMPRLTRDEVGAMIDIGEKLGGVTFSEDAANIVYEVSNGSPYLTRLICHHAGTTALDAERTAIVRGDIDLALDRMVDEAESRLMRITAQRVRRLQISEQPHPLGVIARAAGTPDGWFARSDLRALLDDDEQCDAALAIVDRELVGDGLVEEDRSGGEIRYRFVDEGLPNFLWVTIARETFGGGATDLSPVVHATAS